MAKIARPAQGRNDNKKIVKRSVRIAPERKTKGSNNRRKGLVG